MKYPDRNSPVGCVVGLLGLLPLAVTGVSVWGMFRYFSVAEADRPDGLLKILLIAFFASISFSGLGIWGALKLHRNTDWKSYDPDLPL